MFNKKGAEEGKAVGVLILIIALFMVLYIIFIPPEEREQLLYPNATLQEGTTAVEKLELLAESPGFVSPLKQEITEHNLMPVNLYIKSEPKTITLAQSLSITKGLFSKSFPTLYFNLDMKDLKKVTLFFSVSKASGDLRISVNGNQFYSEELKPGVKIIEIPLSFLAEKNNALIFSVSSPGIAFWSSNSYILNDLGLKQEFELINSKEERTFTISQQEKDSLQSAVLSFFQLCNMKIPKQLAPLKIYFNDNPIPVISTKIRCISQEQTIELKPEDFESGPNKLSFVLEESGDFSFNELKVLAEAKQTDYPSYTFGISKNQYDDIKAGTKKIQIELYLEDNKKSKNARISLNSGDIFMQEKSSEFKYDIKDYVEQGSNFIRIVPNNEFVITGLKVTLE